MRFPCPICKEMKRIQINRRAKPYLRCDDCGVLMFVNKPYGITYLETGKVPKPQELSKKTAASALFGS
jgi:phage FluMu protein Com